MITKIFFVICLSLMYILWKIKQRLVLQPPTLPGWLPVFGHGLRFLGASTNTWKVLQQIAQETMNLGGVSTIAIGPYVGYVITDPDDCATAANASLMKNYYYGFAVPWLGEGLLTANEWKRHRKILNPAFSQLVLNGFIEAFNSQSRRLVHKWYSKVGPFKHHRDLCLNNLDMICQTTYGLKIESTEYAEAFRNALDDMLYVMSERFKKIWLHFDVVFNLSSLKRRQDEAVRVLHQISNMVVENKKLKRKQMHENGLQKERNYRSFLDVMIQTTEGKDCSDKDLRQEVDNIIFAGHDSMSSTLAIAILFLGTYPDKQEKTVQEMQVIFGDTDRDVSKEDLNKMRYTEAVLKETLRLYPIAPVIARYVDTDVNLKNFTMKAGNSCYLLFNGVHLNPMWGPDAREFRPERWLHPIDNAYFTAFSLGKRVCIGRNYSMTYMKIVLIHLLRKYRIKADITRTEFKLETVLKPAAGDEISLEMRK